MTDDEPRWDAVDEGMELLREGSVDEAIVELERVIATDPDNAYAYFFLGAAHFERGDFERAMKAYLVTLEKSPDYVGAMVGLGHTLRMMGRYDQAIRMGRQVLSRKKDDTDGLHLMGLVHYARGDEHAALGYLERFLASSPEFEPAQEARGLVEILRGKVGPLPEED